MHFHKKWVVNLNNQVIPKHVERYVALGPKFNVKTDSLTTKGKFEIINNVENNLFKIPHENKDKVRTVVIEEIVKGNNQRKQHINYQDKLFLQNLEEKKIRKRA